MGIIIQKINDSTEEFEEFTGIADLTAAESQYNSLKESGYTVTVLVDLGEGKATYLHSSLDDTETKNKYNDLLSRLS